MRVTRQLVVLVIVLASAALLLVAAGCGTSTAPPSPTPTPTPTLTPSVMPSVSSATLLDALKAGDLSAFGKALQSAGLQKLFGGKGPYTLFVPNDQAFKSVSLSQLRQDLPNLKNVIQYHVIKGQDVKLAQAVDGASFTTMEGQPVTFHIAHGTLMVEDAAVVQATEGADWTIYVIDKVLTPPLLGSGSPSPSPTR
jgi:uncharacterized surface protein with fasciclin (FAS1) repeats